MKKRKNNYLSHIIPHTLTRRLRGIIPYNIIFIYTGFLYSEIYLCQFFNCIGKVIAKNRSPFIKSIINIDEIILNWIINFHNLHPIFPNIHCGNNNTIISIGTHDVMKIKSVIPKFRRVSHLRLKKNLETQ